MHILRLMFVKKIKKFKKLYGQTSRKRLYGPKKDTNSMFLSNMLRNLRNYTVKLADVGCTKHFTSYVRFGVKIHGQCSDLSVRQAVRCTRKKISNIFSPFFFFY